MDFETRDQAVARYEALRKVNVELHTRALGMVSTPALLSTAKKLGLAQGGALVAHDDDLDLLSDLALYTAAPGRSRAIERCARAMREAPGSDERIVMEAMLAARFSLWRVERRHPIAGLVLRDMVGAEELWLMDLGLESWATDGVCFASRVFTPAAFSMTCGVVIPFDKEGHDELVDACARLDATADCMPAHRKFATELYRFEIAARAVAEAREWAA